MSISSAARADDKSSQLSGLEYANYDGLGLSELIAKKKITPLELLKAVHQRVDAFNPVLQGPAARDSSCKSLRGKIGTARRGEGRQLSGEVQAATLSDPERA